MQRRDGKNQPCKGPTKLREPEGYLDADIEEVDALVGKLESDLIAVRAQLQDVQLENIALRDNNIAIKAMFDERAIALVQLKTLRSALVGLVGVDTREELEQLEVVMRLMPAPAADKAATINAIHALIATEGSC